MNKERILTLASLIETQPHTTYGAKSGFDMSSWLHQCNTPSCIAGWACSLKYFSKDLADLPRSVRKEAEDYLGLPEETGRKLFIPMWGLPEIDADRMREKVTPAQAAFTLRKLVETGEVDWSHVE